ncbi:MAG: hypothetical protein ACK55I_27760, partial [bacterium]
RRHVQRVEIHLVEDAAPVAAEVDVGTTVDRDPRTTVVDLEVEELTVGRDAWRHRHRQRSEDLHVAAGDVQAVLSGVHHGQRIESDGGVGDIKTGVARVLGADGLHPPLRQV